MHIQDVDLPGTLVEAQKNGLLVVFAGAGVSIPPPSNYPNFDDLAIDVAKGSLIREDKEPVDRFLGRLHARGVRVHEIVRQRLSSTVSAPTKLHENLLRLFRSGPALKLVTTNFDLHFSTAGLAVFKGKGQFETYSAPALPLGDSFSGLVYLHGSVDRTADRMVLTDADFGRAYLTEGWARRFLQQLFSRYVVFFIGYSHRDPVMNYLARGLPPESGGPRRFALTLQEDSEEWKFRGVVPIVYPKGDGSEKHGSIATMIAGWVDRAKMSALELEEQLKGIVESPVSLNAERLDLVREALKDAAGTRFFTRYCKRTDWLRWTESNGLLKKLFMPDSSIEEKDSELASWFAERFVCEHLGVALAIVQRQGQSLHEVLWLAIAHHLFRTKDPRPEPEIFGQWVPVLMNCVPRRGTRDLFDYILARSGSPASDAVAILLFEYLTRPHIVLKKNLWRENEEEAEASVSVELSGQGNEYWLTESWNRIFRPRLADFSDRLIWIVTSHIQHAFLLLKSWGKIHDHWDQLNAQRNIIESSGGIRNSIDVLIDTGKEILELYITERPNRADSIIEMWMPSECRLLKRLAIYGIAKNGWSADKKIDWLLEQDLFFVSGLKHEVFLVLRDAYRYASELRRKAILMHVEAEPLGQDEETEHKAYEIYNMLVWLHECAPECSLTHAALDQITSDYPMFGPREHPDLDVVVGGGAFIGDASPKTVEELLAQSAEELVEFLLSYQDRSIIGPNRSGLLRVVQSAVSESFEWGLELVGILRAQGLKGSDLWKSILSGWNSRNLSEEEWGRVLANIRDNPGILISAGYEAANLLENGIKKTSHAISRPHLSLAFAVSQQLWEALVSVEEQPRQDPKDWFSYAINDPAGILTHFWLHLVYRMRNHLGEKWSELPLEMKDFFGLVLSDESRREAISARVIMASQLNFLFWSDKKWATDNIVPLLDWSVNPKRAVQSWHGYLVSSVWPEPLLPILITLYEKLFPVIKDQPERISERFCEHLAAIACFGSINPLEVGWLTRFTTLVDPKLRERWSSDVQMMLRQMDDQAKDKAWAAWVSQYWQNRIDGVPVPLTAAEAGKMAEWSIHLEPVFPEAVDKICNGPSPELKNSFLYYELPDTVLPERYPQAVAQLILFLLQENAAPIYDFDRMDRVFEKLVDGKVDRHLLIAICDQLARVGYEGAKRLRALIGNE
ncbi:MAG: hypothetical protein JWM83_125 [Candidatus Angelobacter sp.]|nr:hypothetical protein [Candidatus Angelobacter sp.]